MAVGLGGLGTVGGFGLVMTIASDYDNEEVARRRDAALLRALSTPHKRQSEMKLGRRKRESASDASPKKARPAKSKGD